MGNSLFPLTQIRTFFCILFWLIGIKVLVWSWELHDWQFTEESTNLCKAQWFCGGKSLLKYLHQKEQQPRDYLWAVSVDSGTFFSCTPGLSSLFTIWPYEGFCSFKGQGLCEWISPRERWWWLWGIAQETWSPQFLGCRSRLAPI